MAHRSERSVWKANAIGPIKQTVREWLEKNYEEKSGDNCVELCVKALLEVCEPGSKHLEIAVVRKGVDGADTLDEKIVDEVIKKIEDEKRRRRKRRRGARRQRRRQPEPRRGNNYARVERVCVREREREGCSPFNTIVYISIKLKIWRVRYKSEPKNLEISPNASAQTHLLFFHRNRNRNRNRNGDRLAERL